LAYPQAFSEFVPSVSFVVGFVVALGGLIAVVVQRRRGNLTSRVTLSERRVVRGATGLLALAAGVSGILTVVDAAASQGAAVTGDAAVTMTDFAFAEEEYVIAAGQPATLAVHNGDGFVHDIAIPGLDVAPQKVLPGKDAAVTIAPAEPGTYTIYCTLHSNVSETNPAAAGMAAILIVR
jgi:plastocyanin